jgi:ribosomal protein L12E/L44/L45/RPP1/RPP2
MVRDTPISGVAPEPAWGGAVAQTTEVDVDEATAAPDSTSSTTARPSATRKRAARRTDGTADKVAKATAQSRPTPASKRPRPAKGDAS